MNVPADHCSGRNLTRPLPATPTHLPYAHFAHTTGGTHMTQQPSAPGRPLTATQISRVDFARRDLEYARTTELTDLRADSLIIVVERLRGRLHDMLNLVDEVTQTEPPPMQR